MRIEMIRPQELDRVSRLLLPHVYEKIKTAGEETDVIVLALIPLRSKIVSVLAAELEPTGDIGILSIYTLADHRRQGYASRLIGELLHISLGCFQWEEEPEEDIVLKTIYRLPEDMEQVYRFFLEKNHFTDFVILDGASDPKVFCAFVELKFFCGSSGEGLMIADER